jgi:hypothetical protein
MRITSVDVGSGTALGREKRVVTVRLQLSLHQQETMRVTVIVPKDGDENAARECGIARAKDFARQFSNL